MDEHILEANLDRSYDQLEKYKALLKRCLPTISYMADISDEVAKLLADIEEYLV